MEHVGKPNLEILLQGVEEAQPDETATLRRWTVSQLNKVKQQQ